MSVLLLSLASRFGLNYISLLEKSHQLRVARLARDEHSRRLGVSRDTVAPPADGEVPVVGPEGKEVAIVRAVGVAGLAGRVDADGSLPVAQVHDDPERRPRGLVVAAAGRAG